MIGTTSVHLIYSLLWFLALPFVVLRLLWRARRQPAYLQNVAERFGRYRNRLPAPVIWIHAVSVGETRAAEPLIRALLERWPRHSIVLTHMTPTGRETSRSLFGQEPRVVRCYLPYDLRWFCDRFLNHFRPTAGIIMETELWPTLLSRCRTMGIPVILANARLSERSANRYARWPELTRRMLAPLAAIGCQTDADRERLERLGARTARTTGNLKFDVLPPDAMLTLSKRFRSRCGGRPVILAASTREGEEALILKSFAGLAPSNALLAIVPRHPQRFDAVAALISDHGLALQRRSEDESVRPSTRVWLGDTMGEMFAYYAAADLSLIGGSWLPHGGQNPIEACAVGTPILLGPHTFNFEEVARQAIECGAAWRASDVDSGMRRAIALLSDPVALDEASEAGRRFAAAHRGATDRTLDLIGSVLSAADRPSTIKSDYLAAS